ncbi:MAG TPA: MFS transporter [Herpetosiphonaceae bacterium]
MHRMLHLWRGRLYYGWVLLGAVSVTEVISWGILYYAFTVFIAPMQADLGWSREALTGAYSLALLCSGLAAVPVGRWLDRHGPRALMTAGSCLGSLLLVAWSQVTTLWSFYLIMAGIGLVMATNLYEPAFALIATWFRRRRGRALTILTFFGAWASFVFIPLSAQLVLRYGWRAALLILAIILAGITIPLHALALRRSPEDLGLRPDGGAADESVPVVSEPPDAQVPLRAALHEADFWWFTAAFAVSTFATVALTVHLIPYLTEQGVSAASAASVAGLFGLMSVAGRLIIGPLGDRYPRQVVTAGLMGMQALGVVVLVLSPTTPGAVVSIALFGAGSGTLTIMRAALLAERYGSAHYGSINGAMSFWLTMARTLAPISAALLAGHFGGYRRLLWTMVVLTTLGGMAVLQIGRPSAAASRALPSRATRDDERVRQK